MANPLRALHRGEKRRDWLRRTIFGLRLEQSATHYGAGSPRLRIYRFNWCFHRPSSAQPQLRPPQIPPVAPLSTVSPAKTPRFCAKTPNFQMSAVAEANLHQGAFEEVPKELLGEFAQQTPSPQRVLHQCLRQHRFLFGVGWQGEGRKEKGAPQANCKRATKARLQLLFLWERTSLQFNTDEKPIQRLP